MVYSLGYNATEQATPPQLQPCLNSLGPPPAHQKRSNSGLTLRNRIKRRISRESGIQKSLTTRIFDRPTPQQYYFKFKSNGELLFGTVRYVEPPGNPTGIVYPAGNGKIEGDKISFEYFGGWKRQDGNGNLTPVKESFVRTVSKGQIHFTYQREEATPFEFSATKIHGGPVDLSK